MNSATTRSLAPLLAALLACVLATSAMASGINLYWDDCSAGGATTNKNFACNTNSGSNTLYISYDPPAVFTDLVAVDARIDIQSASSPLPSWWQFVNAGSCRQMAMIATTPTSTCSDPFLGVQTCALGAYHVSPDLGLTPDRARLDTYAVVPATTPVDVATPGTEYCSLALRITNAKTVGSCSGCQTAVCLVLNWLQLTRNGMPPGPVLNSPLTSNVATWQGGSGTDCVGAVPALNRTWGLIKSIYH